MERILSQKEFTMSDKDQPKTKDKTKPGEPIKKGNGGNEEGISQHIPNDKGKANTNNNPAGQGNEGDDVMPAGRETPG